MFPENNKGRCLEKKEKHSLYCICYFKVKFQNALNLLLSILPRCKNFENESVELSRPGKKSITTSPLVCYWMWTAVLPLPQYLFLLSKPQKSKQCFLTASLSGIHEIQSYGLCYLRCRAQSMITASSLHRPLNIPWAHQNLNLEHMLCAILLPLKQTNKTSWSISS